jgi:PAS domain S-box-containing protein
MAESLWGSVAEALQQDKSSVQAPYIDDIIHSMNDILIVIDHNAKVVMVNEAALRFLGYTEDELLGTPFWGILAEEMSGVMNDIMIGNVEKTLLAKDGRKIPVSFSGSVVRAKNNSIRGIVCVAQDITERKRMEVALARRAEELAQSNVELEQFAYVASHDLQEPLRMITSFLQLLSRRYAEKLDETADEYISFAVDGASRMQGLIHALLEYSRVGTQGNAYESASLEDVLEQALGNLGVALQERGAKVTHGPLPTMIIDEVLVRQLFQNLIGNAIKFCGDKIPEVQVGAEQREEDWLITIRDNGIGMDPESKERIFEIFQRLVPREEYEGTGIGLSVCKKIVERRGGRIWVDSELGGGRPFPSPFPWRCPHERRPTTRPNRDSPRRRQSGRCPPRAGGDQGVQDQQRTARRSGRHGCTRVSARRRGVRRADPAAVDSPRSGHAKKNRPPGTG